MSEPFVGEIQMFAGNFAPRGWALCDGQLLSIDANSALYALIGTTFGGDGEGLFALPDLRGRIPVGVGTGPGRANVAWGERAGAETVTLTTAQLPGHTHTLRAEPTAATNATGPENALLADTGDDAVYGPVDPEASMDAASIGSTGSGQPQNNMAPSLTINFIIALVGVFPSE